jgi:hypothetical protein
MSEITADPQDSLIRTVLISASVCAVLGFLTTVLAVAVMVSLNFNFLNFLKTGLGWAAGGRVNEKGTRAGPGPNFLKRHRNFVGHNGTFPAPDCLMPVHCQFLLLVQSRIRHGLQDNVYKPDSIIAKDFCNVI